MHSLPQSASNALPSLPDLQEPSSRSRRAEDLAYQSLTVAAILLLLGSLWVF
jgi:hypothetical protein